jgi:hypothetical protein
VENPLLSKPNTRRRCCPSRRFACTRSTAKYVATQPYVICGLTSAEAHHLRFAQPRALGRKVSDEQTVPVRRLHRRELSIAMVTRPSWRDRRRRRSAAHRARIVEAVAIKPWLSRGPRYIPDQPRYSTKRVHGFLLLATSTLGRIGSRPLVQDPAIVRIVHWRHVWA